MNIIFSDWFLQKTWVSSKLFCLQNHSLFLNNHEIWFGCTWRTPSFSVEEWSSWSRKNHCNIICVKKTFCMDYINHVLRLNKPFFVSTVVLFNNRNNSQDFWLTIPSFLSILLYRWTLILVQHPEKKASLVLVALTTRPLL